VVSVLRPKFDDVRRTEARLEVDRVKDALALEGIEVDSAIPDDADPATAVVELARQRGADLIVMGSHGRTGLGRLLLGSVSEQVIGQATCPVLVVKAWRLAICKSERQMPEDPHGTGVRVGGQRCAIAAVDPGVG